MIINIKRTANINKETHHFQKVLTNVNVDVDLDRALFHGVGELVSRVLDRRHEPGGGLCLRRLR